MKAKIILLFMSGIFLLPSLNSYAVETVYVTGYRNQYVPDYVWDSVRRQIEQAAAAAAAQAQRDAEAKAKRDAEEQARKAQEKAQKCAAEKGKIEQEYTACNTSVSSDKLRETGGCNQFGNAESSWSGGFNYKMVFGSGTYTIQNPTYEKCINMVNALAETLKDQCAERKANQEALARVWDGAACSGFYQ